MQTNLQEDDKQPSLFVTVLKFTGVWVVFTLVVLAAGGALASGPEVPAGMSWLNADASGFSTFDILRGGDHLVLVANRRSEWLMVVIVCLTVVVFAFVAWRGFQGKMRSRTGRPISRGFQSVLSVLLVVLAIWLLYWPLGSFIRGKRVEFDPAADRVSIDGGLVARFQDLEQFQFYTTTGSKGGIAYHLAIELQGERHILLDPIVVHPDVQSLPPYLNAYLAEVRAVPHR